MNRWDNKDEEKYGFECPWDEPKEKKGHKKSQFRSCFGELWPDTQERGKDE